MSKGSKGKPSQESRKSVDSGKPSDTKNDPTVKVAIIAGTFAVITTVITAVATILTKSPTPPSSTPEAKTESRESQSQQESNSNTSLRPASFISDWLKEGQIIALQTQAHTPGPKWLDGRSSAETIGLALSTEGTPSTQWKVHIVEDRVITLEALAYTSSPKWLNSSNGIVGLAPSEDVPDTRWRIHVAADGIALETLSSASEYKWLDGISMKGTVELAPATTGIYTGTKWKVFLP